MNILGLIPARGGSKGVPEKNIRLLQGKPLLWYTAMAALNSPSLSRVVLSTDDNNIAKIGKQIGLEVPFLRPAELAKDDTPTLPVIQHAVRILEKNAEKFDAICLLQPTSPLRDESIIEGCLKQFINTENDTVITISPVPEKYNPHFVYFKDNEGLLEYSMGENTKAIRRQDVPPAYLREGSVYVMRRNILMDDNTIYGKRVIGYPVAAEKSINIDTMEDWQEAEVILRGQKQQK